MGCFDDEYLILNVSLVRSDSACVVQDGQRQDGCRIVEVGSEHFNEAILSLERFLT